MQQKEIFSVSFVCFVVQKSDCVIADVQRNAYGIIDDYDLEYEEARRF